MSEFIRKNAAFIVAGAVCILLGVVLTFLYDVPLEFQLYFSAFLVIVETVVFVIQYAAYRKEQLNEAEKERQAQQPADNSWQKLREREDFLALWTHQIKTPIAALNLILQSKEPDIPACRSEVFRIEGYVEMLLGYLRFDEMRNDLLLVNCDLELMVRQVVKKYAPVFISKHLSVRLENLGFQILTDEKWFCFCIEQILSNALKYTPSGGIRIFAENDGEEIRIMISDTGIGVRNEDIPRLFEKGFTGYNGRMDKKASGIGLYLCKGVCDRLGHKISLSSKEQEGTTVTITVPAEKVNRANLTKL